MKPAILSQLFIMLCVMLCACARSGTDPRLSEINDIIDSERNPREALKRLEMIDRSRLSEADRHYCDLLTVKAHDKAYDRHQSDSLILDVIGWYDVDPSDPRYAEAQYYGGRVCSDLGDLPRALTYFEKALDCLPENTNRIEFRGHVISQTARILIRLRLYDEAIRYLEEALQLSIARKDTLDLPYDHMLLGNVYKYKKDLNNANRHLTEALHLSRHLQDSDYIGMQGELAILKYDEGKTDSALILIRGVVENLSGNDRDYFIANSLKIYHKAGIADTAMLYARQAVTSSNLSYQISGYAALLSPELIGYLPADSVVDYAMAYSRAVSASRNKNAEEAAIAQNALYNYSRYRLDNERLDREIGSLWMKLYVAVTLIAALAGSVWYAVKLYRRKKADYDIQAGSLESLRNSMDALESELRRYTSDPDLIHITGIGAERSKQITEAIEKLVRQLGVVGRTINDGAETEGYRALRDVLTTKRVLPHDSEIWNKVYDSVDEISPGFRDRIAEMSDGQVTEDDFRLACMIRLGFNMVAAAQIFGRTKSTMSYRRSILCEHLLGSSVSPSQLVTVIINL